MGYEIDVTDRRVAGGEGEDSAAGRSPAARPVQWRRQTSGMRVLLVEDDAKVANHVADGLREEGFEVEIESNGKDAYARMIVDNEFDVIVLDRMLPGVEGLEILRHMRSQGVFTPVLIVSALGELDERVKGLQAGSDDYLAKPFDLNELLARVQALARRAQAPDTEKKLVIGDLELDILAREVRRGGKRIELSKREFRLLEYLMRNAGHVLTRSMILKALWDYNFDPQTNIVDQHVRNLRLKIDRVVGPSLIETVRGAGYMFRRR